MKPLLVVLVAVFALRATGGAAATPRPNVVVFASNSDIAGGFNTWLSCCNALAAADMAGTEVLHGAFLQNAKGEWVKDLVTDAQADKRGVSYTISPKAFWYWGGRKVAVTYRDFLYILRAVDNPANEIVSRGVGFGNLDPTRFEHHGDRRVTFFWKTANCSADYPCGPFANWQSLFSQLYPSFALQGQDFNKIWTNCICGSDGKPVANGPFYLASYTRGQGSVLKANPYYHDRARLAEVDFKVIADAALQVGAIRDGQVDAIFPSFAPDLLTLRSVAGLIYTTSPRYALEQFELREGSARGAPGMTKGGSNVLLRAPWMRQAIMLALDRQAMIDTLYGPNTGLKPTNSYLYFPGQAGYRPNFARWNYAPAKAIAILRQHCTGGPTVPDPSSGKTWRCAGLPALFQYTWPSTSAGRTTIEQLAKANLRAVGIGIVDRPLPGDVIFGPAGLTRGDFDLAEFAWDTDGYPGGYFELFRCFGDTNYMGYCSHTVDSLLRSANKELDPAKRTALFGRADAILATELPAIPLFQKPGALVHKSELLGMGPNAAGSGPFWNIQDWHWKR